MLSTTRVADWYLKTPNKSNMEFSASFDSKTRYIRRLSSIGLATTKMASMSDENVVLRSSDRSMSVMGRVAVVLGSEENALRILFSLLLGLSLYVSVCLHDLKMPYVLCTVLRVVR